MSAITYEQFLAWSGYTASTVPNEANVSRLLDSVCEILEDDLNVKFSLTADKTKIYPGQNTNYIVIGGWQSEGLDIKIKYNGEDGESLTEFTEYTKKYFQDNDEKPVIGISLLNGLRNYGYYNNTIALRSDDYLVVNGTYGWSNGFPVELQNIVFNLVKHIAETENQFTSTQGAGFEAGLRSNTLTVSSAKMPDDLIKELVGIGFDPAGAKQIQRVTRKYKNSSLVKASIS